jgi:multiple sugar transport system substrate-binding protein
MSTSADVKSAYKFASFLAGKEGAMILAEYGILPAFSNSDVISSYQRAVGADGIENLLTSLTVPEAMDIPEFSEIVGYYSEEKELYLIGEQSIDQAMQNFSARRDERLNR